MRYQPERALTQKFSRHIMYVLILVEMRYQPERALTPVYSFPDTVLLVA